MIWEYDIPLNFKNTFREHRKKPSVMDRLCMLYVTLYSWHREWRIRTRNLISLLTKIGMDHLLKIFGTFYPLYINTSVGGEGSTVLEGAELMYLILKEGKLIILNCVAHV